MERFTVQIVKPSKGRGWSVLATRGQGENRRRKRYGRNAGVVDQATAWEAAARIRRALEAGRWWDPGVSGALGSGDLTLTEAAQKYVDSQATRGRRPGTLRNTVMQLHHFGTWMRDRTGGRTIEAFSALFSKHGDDALYEYAADLRRAPPGGFGFADSTALVYAATASRWWLWCARKWRMVVPLAPDVYVPVQPKRTVAPTWAQMDAVIGVLGGWKRRGGGTERLRRMLWIGRNTGLRVGQTLRLLWSDFDLDAGTLDIRPELGKSAAERAGRLVPVTPVLLDEMAGWGRREGLVVGLAKPNSKLLRLAIREAEIPEDVWLQRSSHMFRRGFATGLKTLGADSWSVERLIGHAVAQGESAATSRYVDDRQLVDVLRKATDLVPPVGVDAFVAARAKRAAR